MAAFSAATYALQIKSGAPTPAILFAGLFVLLTPFVVAHGYLVDAGLYVGGPYTGPIEGEAFGGDIRRLVPGDSVRFRSGYLSAYNRSAGESPVLRYHDGARTRWAWVLETREDIGLDPEELRAISDLSVTPGFLRNRVTFKAAWCCGSGGFVYVWKLGGPQHFYLTDDVLPR